MIDFINDDHKEMHEVLLRRGFTFEHYGALNDGVIVFIYKNIELDLAIYYSAMFSDKPKEYQNHITAHNISTGDIYYTLFGKTFKDVTKHFTYKDNHIAIQGITPEASMGGTFYDVNNENWEAIKITTPEVYPNLWDTYAAAALNGLLSCGSLQSMDAAGDLAKFAAELADGLISERAKRNG